MEADSRGLDCDCSSYFCIVLLPSHDFCFVKGFWEVYGLGFVCDIHFVLRICHFGVKGSDP